MRNIISGIAVGFVGFVIWVLVKADAGQPTVFHTFALSLPYGDKIGHFCIFATLTLIINFAFKLRRVSVFKRTFYLGSVVVLIFALLEELSQLMFPKRSFDLVDILADILAILFAGLVTKWLAQRIRTLEN